MQLTGHKTRPVFERYNIVSPGDLRDAARRLDDAGGHTFGPTGPKKAVSATSETVAPAATVQFSTVSRRSKDVGTAG